MKKSNLYIGVLSGTSMDSIDCGIFKFNEKSCESVVFYEEKYPETIKRVIEANNKNLIQNFKTSYLNKEISNEFSKVVNNTLKSSNINPSDISAIGMHGQTISHKITSKGNFSIQLGCPITLSSKTSISVVSDFRQTDINNGGQGAPLAPLFHDFLFQKEGIHRIIVNIGGISNISFLSNNGGEVFGFDSGPGNFLIDSWMKKKFNLNFDDQGNIAGSNPLNPDLVTTFLNDDYFKQPIPKSTSTEYFNYDWILEKLKRYKLSVHDKEVLSSLTNLTAISIIQGIKNYTNNCDEIYICGGGAFNKTILKYLQIEAEKVFNKIVIVKTTEDLNFSPKKVEAGLFAWLAMSKICNTKLDYRNITGSNQISVLGKVFN